MIVQIEETHMPGYGGPETWEFRVFYKRRTLEVVRTTSERAVGRLEDELRLKWETKTPADLDALVAEKTPEWEPCSVCGSDDSGGAYTSTMRWCPKCYAEVKKAEDLERRSSASAQGTFACPICGSGEPHNHEANVYANRDARIADLESALRQERDRRVAAEQEIPTLRARCVRLARAFGNCADSRFHHFQTRALDDGDTATDYPPLPARGEGE